MTAGITRLGRILVTPQGYAKVLDFGLAKLRSSDAESIGAGATQLVTSTGSIVGTPAYMSPEQALGRPIDARTDIFSLGVVLYEALSGRNPFLRTTSVDTLHAITRADAPPVAGALQHAVPGLDWVLGKALARDPDERHQSMRELAADLRRLRALPSAAKEAASSGEVATQRQWPALVAGAVIGGLLATGAGLVTSRLVSRGTSPGVSADALALVPLTTDSGYEGEPTLSPDGNTLAYVSDRAGSSEIFLRQVGGGPDVNLTNHPAEDVQPAFSLDGRSIAFVSSRTGAPLRYSTPESPLQGGEIYVMPALGGQARRVTTGNSPSWSPDGSYLVYVTGGWFQRRLARVPITGGEGTVIPVTFDVDAGDSRLAPTAGANIIRPAYSPDGRFIAFSTPGAVYTVPASGGTARSIAEGRDAAWVRSPLGLVFTSTQQGRAGSLWRVAIAGDSGRGLGAPVRLTATRDQDADVAIAFDGSQLVFAALSVSANLKRVRLAPTGVADLEEQPLTAGTDVVYFGTSSPDERSVVYGSSRRRGIWRADAGQPPVRLGVETSEDDSFPRWAPDGRSIAFSRRSGAEPAPTVWLMAPDGSNPRSVGERALAGFFAWTPDSRAIVLQSPSDRQLYAVEVETKTARRITDEPGIMRIAAVSRDGQSIVFQSTDSPRGNVVLRSITISAGGRSRVVLDTGTNVYHPTFGPSDDWVYFTPDHMNVMRVPGPGQGWRVASPAAVTRLPLAGLFIEDPQISADGRSLIFSRRQTTADLWLLTGLDGRMKARQETATRP